MDPLYVALKMFELRKYDQVDRITTALLEKNPQDEALWTLKMRALTQQVYVDEYEMEYEDVVDQLMDESNMAARPRPGTSLRQPMKTAVAGAGRPGATARPMSRRTGRPVSGMLRPSSRATTANMRSSMATGRGLQTSQPLTAKIGRMLRQGTASMITTPNGPFIVLSRLNLAKYTEKKYLAKPLFEYIFYHDHETAQALQMANAAHNLDNRDWWWLSRRGLCHYRLALQREAERDIKDAASLLLHPDNHLYLSKIYARIDLPAQAIESYKAGSTNFPHEPSMLVGAARIFEELDDLANSTLFYRDALRIDAMNFEALACVGMECYYDDQPELALRYYRRLLQMGVHSAEVFINVGICCFVSQQMDLMWSAFENAFLLCNKEQLADLFYNIGYICASSGEIEYAKRCFQLSLGSSNSNPDALAGLAQLAYYEGDRQKAVSLLSVSITASGQEDASMETLYNMAVFYEELGDYGNAFQYAQMAQSIASGLGAVDRDVRDLIGRLEAAIHSL